VVKILAQILALTFSECIRFGLGQLLIDGLAATHSPTTAIGNGRLISSFQKPMSRQGIRE
jgi:hypothetical protein